MSDTHPPFTLPPHLVDGIAEATDLTWDVVEYAIHHAAAHLHQSEPGIPARDHHARAHYAAAAAVYAHAAQDLDTERDEPGTHRHPYLVAQLRIADHLADTAGIPIGLADRIGHLALRETAYLRERRQQITDDYGDEFPQDLARIDTALAAIEADPYCPQHGPDCQSNDHTEPPTVDGEVT